jgi:hypothetical protein
VRSGKTNSSFMILGLTDFRPYQEIKIHKKR